jgi:hypothetical protein
MPRFGEQDTSCSLFSRRAEIANLDCGRRRTRIRIVGKQGSVRNIGRLDIAMRIFV